MFVMVKVSWGDAIFEDISKLRLGSSNLTTMFYIVSTYGYLPAPSVDVQSIPSSFPASFQSVANSFNGRCVGKIVVLWSVVFLVLVETLT